MNVRINNKSLNANQFSGFLQKIDNNPKFFSKYFLEKPPSWSPSFQKDLRSILQARAAFSDSRANRKGGYLINATYHPNLTGEQLHTLYLKNREVLCSVLSLYLLAYTKNPAMQFSSSDQSLLKNTFTRTISKEKENLERLLLDSENIQNKVLIAQKQVLNSLIKNISFISCGALLALPYLFAMEYATVLLFSVGADLLAGFVMGSMITLFALLFVAFLQLARHLFPEDSKASGVVTNWERHVVTRRETKALKALDTAILKIAKVVCDKPVDTVFSRFCSNFYSIFSL